MWKRFWFVLHMDNTYKTNRFKMAFFQVVVLTNIGTIVPVAFSLVDNERKYGFDRLISQLDGLRTELEIPQPTVVLTDDDTALKNALAETWPESATK